MTSEVRSSRYSSGLARSAANKTAVGYARVVIPLGKRPKRIDCSQLRQLEIGGLKAEIEALTIGPRIIRRLGEILQKAESGA